VAGKSRLDKLGARPGLETVLIGINDKGLGSELRARGIRFTTGRLRKGVELVFLGAESLDHLDRLARCRHLLAPDGAVWVVYPKGQKTLTRNDVIAAGKPARLVDIKIVSFSDTHTALKFVIPKDQR
jgi:hypothetical protein